jgi:hypothetical protein
VELPAGVSEELREIPHALEVSDSRRAPLEHEQPEVALATKDVAVRSGALRAFDPIEYRPRGLVLHDSLVLAAAGAQRFGQTQPGERLLIGRADLVPEPPGFRAQPLRLRRIALGESHSSLSQSRTRNQRLAVESTGHELQLVGG